MILYILHTYDIADTSVLLLCIIVDYYSPDMKAVKIDQELLGEIIR